LISLRRHGYLGPVAAVDSKHYAQLCVIARELMHV
jgi:hypothetical protein